MNFSQRLLVGTAAMFLFVIAGRAQTAMNAAKIGNICFADQQTGADLGVKVNYCDAKLGNTAGEIWISRDAGTTWTTPPKFSAARILRFIDGATYSIALGTLAFSKDVRIDCEGHLHATLNFTGTSGIALLFNFTTFASGSYEDWGYGIRDCEIIGPGGLGGTRGNAGTGIQIGDATHATIGTKIDNVRVSGFATGISWEHCSAWGTVISNSNFLNNNHDLLHNSCSGGALSENIKIDHSIFGWTNTHTMNTEGVLIAGTGTVEINFDDCSFDGDQLVNAGGHVRCINCHFENPGGETTNFYLVSSGVTTLVNPQFGQDSTSGSVPPAFINLTGGQFFYSGLQAYTNTAMRSIMTFNNGGKASVTVKGDIQAVAGTFANGSFAGSNTGVLFNCPDSNANCELNNLRMSGSSGTLFVPAFGNIGSVPACGPNGSEGAHSVANNCSSACTAGGSCTPGGATHCEMYCNGANWVETGR